MSEEEAREELSRLVSETPETAGTALTETYWCESCSGYVRPGNVAAHEQRYHDGAQTCWPLTAYESDPGKRNH